MSKFKFVLLIVCSFMLLSVKGQSVTPKVKEDSTLMELDSLPPKDTLFVKYIPILPKSFIIADAWYFQQLHSKNGDTVINLIKDWVHKVLVMKYNYLMTLQYQIVLILYHQ